MITVCVNGAGGRMGRALVRLISESDNLKLLHSVDSSNNPCLCEDVGIIAGISRPLGIKLSDKLDDKVDVVIDFSTAEGTMSILESCLKHKSALLVGTTGLSQEQMEEIRKAGKEIACLISPNMSIGANLLFNIAPEIARILGESYDIEIIETHHREKKDAPSGTAQRLAEGIGSKTGRKIPVHSLRIGDVVGDHSVIFSTLGERIELTHRVHHRDIFARGALQVAMFLGKAKAGFYTMQDVLRLI
jgi:4-hydroxy-tetrahydrodipicolinate reductase